MQLSLVTLKFLSSFAQLGHRGNLRGSFQNPGVPAHAEQYSNRYSALFHRCKQKNLGCRLPLGVQPTFGGKRFEPPPVISNI